MTTRLTFLLAMLLAAADLRASDQLSLEDGWNNPPIASRLRAYWWWPNGNVTKESITHDLEEMKAKGFGGAVIMDAGGAESGGNSRVPHGPTFFTPEWRELYKHALHEANRLGLIMSLTIQSGWDLGGPSVTMDDTLKKLTWSELSVTGPTNFNASLLVPQSREKFYRDTSVLAYRIRHSQAGHRPIENLAQKALIKPLANFSTPESSALFEEVPANPGEGDTQASEVIDLTAKLDAKGKLHWQAPAGEWQIIRFGCTIADHSKVSTHSEGWDGHALDVFDATAFNHYWNSIVEPLIADAGPLAGTTLKNLFTDSWEIEVVNWTPTLRAEFLKRNGYDLLPWLPVIAGHIVNSRDESDRFLFDFRKTIGDLAIDNHYRLFRDYAHKHNLDIHPESGGPHAVPIDAQRCLGWDDAPMSEFWAWSWEHRIGDENRFFVKQPASAAHTYGHQYVLAEGFTTLGPHWQEHIWDNLKPSFDKALCEGMNLLVWHAFVCSPKSMGLPGQQYFAGTHMNPEVTWWSKSAPFLSYLNRSQWLMQQGLFAADVLYYYGDHVPNFTQLKQSDPAKILPGYDYDVITEEALLDRATVRDGKIVLSDGMSYRVLVLPDRNQISLPVLAKIKELVAAGATVIGPKPTRGETLRDFVKTDAEIAKLGNELWNGQTGKGRVISDRGARETLIADGVAPDCIFEPTISLQPAPQFDFIHRRTTDAEIYFVANRDSNALSGNVFFRVSDKAPELWNAVTGEHKFAAAYEEKDGRTSVPLEFDPCGSWFVVFRDSAATHPALAKNNRAELVPLSELTGPWTVHFDPKWGGPASAQFDSLVSWTTRPESGIKFYSGTAVYEKSFELPASKSSGGRVFLDLGNVRELAEIKVNGKSCGIKWSPPFRADITDAIQPGVNHLAVEVVNFWPNRLIGDDSLPPSQRLTHTNIRVLNKKTPLSESGLFGPVRLLVQNGK